MMMTSEQLQVGEDLLAAADREFENGDAEAGTERLWAAITHTLTAIAGAKGWPYDANRLFPIVKKLTEHDAQVRDILESVFLAARAHPNLVRAEYFRFEYGDTHRARRSAREFIDTVLALTAQSDNPTRLLYGEMQTQKQLKTAQDYLDAADREFENANALAAAERLWEAAQHTLIAVAEGKGWSYDRDDLYPVAEKLARADEQMGEILLTTYFAVGGYPDKVRFHYFVWEDGDSHRMLRVVREFVAMAGQLAE